MLGIYLKIFLKRTHTNIQRPFIQDQNGFPLKLLPKQEPKTLKDFKIITYLCQNNLLVPILNATAELWGAYSNKYLNFYKIIYIYEAIRCCEQREIDARYGSVMSKGRRRAAARLCVPAFTRLCHPKVCVSRVRWGLSALSLSPPSCATLEQTIQNTPTSSK